MRERVAQQRTKLLAIGDDLGRHDDILLHRLSGHRLEDAGSFREQCAPASLGEKNDDAVSMQAAEQVPVEEGARVAEHRPSLNALDERQAVVEDPDQRVRGLAPFHDVEACRRRTDASVVGRPFTARSGGWKFPVIVAVSPVRMVQVPRYEVVDMIPVLHGFVAATGPMLVSLVVRAARVGRRAGGRVRPADGERMLVDVIVVRVVQMTIVQVVGVTVVLHGLVAAAGAVLVRVVRVRRVVGHEAVLSRLIRVLTG